MENKDAGTLKREQTQDVGTVARENYLNGYGCAESILHALNSTRVLDVPDIVLKASTGFGTGTWRQEFHVWCCNRPDHGRRHKIR
jgi:hypothetical protein